MNKTTSKGRSIRKVGFNKLVTISVQDGISLSGGSWETGEYVSVIAPFTKCQLMIDKL